MLLMLLVASSNLSVPNSSHRILSIVDYRNLRYTSTQVLRAEWDIIVSVVRFLHLYSVNVLQVWSLCSDTDDIIKTDVLH